MRLDVNDSDVSGGRPTDAFEPRPAAAAAAATQPAAAKKLSETPERTADIAPPPAAPEPEDKVDPGTNEAVEGTAAHAEVLRAIFGDSDSE